MNYPREFILTRLAIAVTLISTGLFLWQGVELVTGRLNSGTTWMAIEHIAFMGIIVLIMYGAFVYQLARLGYLHRLRSHRPASQAELDDLAFSEDVPGLAFLLPSYKEDARVIRQAIMSCALQQYPNRRVVLLIDDPDSPEDPGLQAARDLPRQLQAVFDVAACRYSSALEGFRNRSGQSGTSPCDEALKLADLSDEAAQWFQEQAELEDGSDHTGRLYVNEVLMARGRAYSGRAEQLRNPASPPSLSHIEREYRRLVDQFTVEISSFERKRYVSLSHAPNKAMNLNSYIDLMGRSFLEVRSSDGLYLQEAPDGQQADLVIRDAEYVTTLDADSILLPEYALRLVHHMEAPGNERVAVAQTPYSAIPGPGSLLERLAGATTDIQYIIHQGFTHHNATYWVGANAVLRKAALMDIRESVKERGFSVGVYIQDRTVIEDTESTVDLIGRGWSLHNYPERLSYSATPPDFGSLLIQRGRWANGGLIILPKLLRHLLGQRSLGAVAEGLMRVHYLISIAAVNVGLVTLLFYPFDAPLESFIWLPVAALPYFYLYGRDMTQRGYSWLDLPRVYALNLMLLPVNLAGVMKSLQQAVTGQKIPFGRTPKIRGRTAAPWRFMVAEYLLLAYVLMALVFDLIQGRYMHASFSMLNGAIFLYVVLRLIGLKESIGDIRLGLEMTGRRVRQVPAHVAHAARSLLQTRSWPSG